jgi:hypothetical protein
MSKEKSDEQKKTNPHHEGEHGVAGKVGDALHGVADAITSAHASGIHLPKTANKIGIAAAIGGEILHNPSGNVVERVVCGAGVALVKETLNVGLAAEAAVVAGTVASGAATPATGVAVAGLVGVSSYKLINKVTEPIGKAAEKVCHVSFEFGREKAAQLSKNTTFENA